MKKKDKERFDKLKQLGCVACSKFGRYTDPVIHHIRKNTGLSLRPSHQNTIPLCEMHHRLGKDSIHLGKNLFIEKYGTEQAILQQVNKQLELMEDAYNLFGDK